LKRELPWVRILLPPPGCSTPEDERIRTGADADEKEEKRDFRSAAVGDEAGRAMAKPPRPHRSNPTPSARMSGDTPLPHLEWEPGTSPKGLERWPSRLKATAC
jgi:hypothetical protein